MKTKKFISLILSFVLIFSLALPVSAEETDSTEISAPIEFLDETDAVDNAAGEELQSTDNSAVEEVTQETDEETVNEETSEDSSNLPNTETVTDPIEEATTDEETTTEEEKAPAVLTQKQEAKRMSAAEVSKASGQQWEMENNDSMNTANRIYPNTSCSGYLSSSNDTDWYRFTTGSNGYISVTLNHTYVENDWNYWGITLYKADGSSFYDMSVSGHETSKRSCRLGLPAGTYYVKINDDYFSNVNYNLRVNYVAADYWETESNNTNDTADSISPNKSVTGSVMNSSDVDWYKFTTKSNGYISMTLNHAYINSNLAFWKVTLCKSDGSGLHEIYVSGTNTSARSCRLGLPAGTYYVKVGKDYHSSVDYNLRVNYVAAGYWETESNNTQSTADNIAPNASVTASLMTSSDTDYYKFTTKSSGYISLTLNHSYIDNGTDYWKTRLYRVSDGALLNESYYRGNVTSGKTCRIGIPAGSYYVQVSKGYYHSDMDYNLRVNYVADSSYETELNDTPATADAIKKNVVSRGTLMTEGDEDYYTFTLASKCYVNFRLTHGYIEDEHRYFHLTVSNRSNTPMLEYDLTGTEVGTNQGMVLSAGTYYVKINSGAKMSNWERHSTTPYGLLVQPILK